MDFIKWIDIIYTSIMDFLNLLLELPKFIISFLGILPTEIQIIISSGLGLLGILLIYRFIK